jgi:plasmid stabilization system protein ParE
MIYTVIFALEARHDLANLFDYLAERKGEDFARAYVQRIV